MDSLQQTKSKLFRKKHLNSCAKRHNLKLKLLDLVARADRNIYPWVDDQIVAKLQINDKVVFAIPKYSETTGTVISINEKCNFGIVFELINAFIIFLLDSMVGVLINVNGTLKKLMFHRRLVKNINGNDVSPQLTNVIDASNPPLFEKGDHVLVARRTWRGINKPGGVARIISVLRSNYAICIMCYALSYFPYLGDSDSIPKWVYDVRYPVEGCSEKKVDEKYLSSWNAAPNSTAIQDPGRYILGRCRCVIGYWMDIH